VDYWDSKAVVVTTNYRLNVFGFLGADELRAYDAVDGSTGNYGMQDQRQAMQWVQDNIASFGGDKTRVSIFGESAGAGSVTNHLSMQKSWNGLFQSAIMESGAFAEWAIQNMTLSQSAFDRLLVQTGCADAACMRAMSTADLYAAAELIPSESVEYLHPYNPTVDGVEVDTHPWISMANGDVLDVPILIGTNSDEGVMFTAIRKAATEAELLSFWTGEGFTALEQEAMWQIYVEDATYPEVEGDTVYWWAGQRSLGDASMSCPAKNAAQVMQGLSNRKSDTYLYHFEHLTDGQDYVLHTAEINFVFHNFLALQELEDREMSDVMSSYWGNFLLADEHDPNSRVVGTSVVPLWSAYSPLLDQSMSMRETAATSEVVTGLKKVECAFMIGVLDADIRADFDDL
jgi:carboxylesterase type B